MKEAKVLKEDIGYSNEKGNVRVDRNILLAVITYAIKEVKGVAGLVNISKKLKRKNAYSSFNAVKIAFTKTGVDVSVYVNVYCDASVSVVASKVQESIINGIKSLIDVKVDVVNVYVMSAVIKEAV